MKRWKMYKKIKKFLKTEKTACFKAHRTLFIVGLMLLLIEILPYLASAQLTFIPNEPADIKVSCFDVNDNFCAASTVCNITIVSPNATVISDNEEMTNQGNYFNYTTPILTERGEYNCIVSCEKSGVYGYTSFTFVVTGIPAISQGNVAVGILLSLVAIAFLFVFIGFKFIQEDQTFPIALFFILVALIISVYVIYLGFIYSRDILVSSLATSGQQAIFIGILLGLTGIVFIALLFLIIKALKEIKIRKSIQRYGSDYNLKTKMYKGN